MLLIFCLFSVQFISACYHHLSRLLRSVLSTHTHTHTTRPNHYMHTKHFAACSPHRSISSMLYINSQQHHSTQKQKGLSINSNFVFPLRKLVFSFKHKAIFIYLYSNKLHSVDIFYKQHIKIFVLSKTLITSPTCFGHYLTIIREILYLS